MENEEQRIWNKSELEQMPEWKEDKQKDWLHIEKRIWITEKFLGKPVEALKEMNYPVFYEMIAKTDTPISPEIQKSIDEAHKRLNKGEGITLENGTALKVGEKVTQLSWDDDQFIDITFIGKRFTVGLDNNGDEGVYFMIEDWKPYTEPKEEPKPLKGYKEYFILTNEGSLTRCFLNDKQLKEMREMNPTIIRKIYTRQEAVKAGLTI